MAIYVWDVEEWPPIGTHIHQLGGEQNLKECQCFQRMGKRREAHQGWIVAEFIRSRKSDMQAKGVGK